jgi:hypothetical protein
VRLVVGALTPPVISNVSQSGGNLIIGGTGPTNENYLVLTSTNLVLPLPSWTRLATNQFSGAGMFAFTNAINPGLPQRYYRLQLP